jgi:hypothetical protein
MLTEKNTPNGQILSFGPVSPEMEAAADECFLAYKVLNQRLEAFKKTIPEGFGIRNFYGNGECVIIYENEDPETTADY